MMKCPMFLPVVAVSLAAFVLPAQTFAQSTNVRSPNKNQSAKFKSVIVKGSGNLIQSNATASFIGGGQSNKITLAVSNAIIVGGFENTVGANFGSVPGGLGNSAAGEYSFAAGRRAKANHAGSFVWADSTDADFASGGTDQFLLRAKFVGINCNAPLSGFDVFHVKSAQTDYYGGIYVSTSGSGLPFYGYSVDGVQADAWSYVDGQDANKWKLFVGNDDRITIDPSTGNVGIGTTTPANPLELASGARCTAGGVWANGSDANSKENFRPVDIKQILARVAALPISKWNYIAEPNVDRIGPMAQDFHAAFGLGDSDKTIGTVDSDGVLYAAIQGLVEELKERDKAMAVRDETIAELKSKLQAVEERLNSLPPAP